MQNPQAFYEDAKAYLMKANEEGESLYDLLAKMIHSLKTQKYDKDYISIPEYLSQMMEDELKYVQPDLKKKYWEKNKPEELHLKRCSRTNKLLGRMKKVKSDQSSGVSDIIDEIKYFEMAGISIPDEELFKIAISMKLLAKQRGLKKLRFFGKIFGIHGDYIIVESEHVDRSEKDKKMFPDPIPQTKEERMNPPEKPGEGTNKNSYFVCKNAGDPWIQLPDVSPQQIMCARLIKKYFTGDLNAKISSYPPFPGVEANYLRAQIARIAAATTLAPNGFFKEPEEEEGEEEEAAKKPAADLIQNDEFEEKPAESFTSLENWVHVYPMILDFGRCRKFIPPKPPKKDEEEEEAEEEEEEPPKLVLLTPLDKDTPAMSREKKKKKKKPKKAEEGEEEEEEEEEEPEEEELTEEELQKKKDLEIPAWSVMLRNDIVKQFAVAIIKSNRWKGAYSFVCEGGKKFASIYFGNGLKETGIVYTPLIPEKVEEEAADMQEMIDPSFGQEKIVLGGEELDEEPDANPDEEDQDSQDEEEED